MNGPALVERTLRRGSSHFSTTPCSVILRKRSTNWNHVSKGSAQKASHHLHQAPKTHISAKSAVFAIRARREGANFIGPEEGFSRCHAHSFIAQTPASQISAPVTLRLAALAMLIYPRFNAFPGSQP